MWGPFGIWLGKGRLFIHPWCGFIPRDLIYSHRLARSLAIPCKWHWKERVISKVERMLKISICQLNASSYSCFLLPTVICLLSPCFPKAQYKTPWVQVKDPTVDYAFSLRDVCLITPSNIESRAHGSVIVMFSGWEFNLINISLFSR